MNSLSVIIPNYNKAEYLRECVQSILKQTLLPDEILVVDDCSNDDSRSLIEDLCRQNHLIKGIFLPENGGVSHARNVGLQAATSVYVTFIDADDFYGNIYKLQNEMNLIQSYEDEVVAYSKYMLGDEKGNVLNKNGLLDKAYLTGDIYERMLTGRFEFSTVARDYCVKKSILEECGGYNEKRNLYEDLELIIKISEKYPFYCTFQTGTVYRQLSNGLSKRSLGEHKKARNDIFYENIEGKPWMKKSKLICQWQIYWVRQKIRDVFWIIVNRIRELIRQ